MASLKGTFPPVAMTYQEYDQNYPQVFAEIERMIHEILPSALIEHVGSTSVPGLGGRRVLDIVMPTEDAQLEEVIAKLLALGFTKSHLTHIQPMLTRTIDYNGTVYPILLYVLAPTHEIYRGWITFRDYMKAHPDEITAYAAVKRKAVSDGNTAPRNYQQAKMPYLEQLAAKIEGQKGARR